MFDAYNREAGQQSDKTTEEKLSEGWKSFSFGVTKNFGIAKQWGLQKAGQVAPSSEDPEFAARLEKLALLQATFSKLDGVTSSVATANPDAPNPVRQLLAGDLKEAQRLSSAYRLAKLDLENRNASVDALAGKATAPRRLAGARALRDQAVTTVRDIRSTLSELIDKLDKAKNQMHHDMVEHYVQLLHGTKPKWEGWAGHAWYGNKNQSSKAEAASAVVSAPAPPQAAAKAKAKKGKNTLVLDESLLS